MVLFACDLDNTLIYSYKHIAAITEPVCVEWLNGAEQSYMSRRTVEILQTLANYAVFIPVTTRSVEQYRRIIFPGKIVPEFALVANGAILLRHGEIDRDWLDESLVYARAAQRELRQLADIFAINTEPNCTCRMVDDMYLFLRGEDEAQATDLFFRVRAKTCLAIGISGRKVYVFPDRLDKGTALVRLKAFFNSAKVFSAGDSPLDVPMLQNSDVAFVPTKEMAARCSIGSVLTGVVVCDDETLFAEQMLDELVWRVAKTEAKLTV